MPTDMKTIPDTTDPLSLGRMIITCEDHGGLMVPRVEFDPPGKITQGWFERHQSHFQRAIQRAQVEQRQQLTQGVDR